MAQKDESDIPSIGKDDVTLFDLFTQHLDWHSLPEERRTTITTTLMMLLACVEGNAINGDKLASLVNSLTDRGNSKAS